MAAVQDDADAVDHHLHVLQDMGGKEDGLALLAQGEDQRAQVLAADGVEAGERFIQDQEIGIMDQGLGQAQALDHALGEFAQLQVLVAAQPHLVDQGGDLVPHRGGRKVEQ